MYSSDSLVSTYLGVLTVSALIGIIVAVVIYILIGVGLSTMAKNKGLNNPWLAWIPIGNMYLLGELINDKISFGGFIIPKAKIILPVLWGLYIIIGFITTRVASFLYIALLLFIVFYILHLGAIYRLYKLYRPGSAVMYLVLSIIFGIALPICIYIIRNDEPHEYLPGFSDEESHAQQQTFDPGFLVCAKCGEANMNGAMYCRKCGHSHLYRNL